VLSSARVGSSLVIQHAGALGDGKVVRHGWSSALLTVPVVGVIIGMWLSRGRARSQVTREEFDTERPDLPLPEENTPLCLRTPPIEWLR
jgi:hypothetical protein